MSLFFSSEGHSTQMVWMKGKTSTTLLTHSLTLMKSNKKITYEQQTVNEHTVTKSASMSSLIDYTQYVSLPYD